MIVAIKAGWHFPAGNSLAKQGGIGPRGGVPMDPDFLKGLIRTIPDMIWLKDPAGVLLACNPATATFLNRPESEVLGKSDHDFFPAEGGELDRARDLEAAASHGPVTHREWVVFQGDGHRALMETIKTAM